MNTRYLNFFPSTLPSRRDLKLASYVTLGALCYLINCALAAERGCEHLISIIENDEFTDYFVLDMEEFARDEKEIADDLQKAGICDGNQMIDCEALSKNKEYREHLPSLFKRDICRSEWSGYFREQERQRKERMEMMQQNLPTLGGFVMLVGSIIVAVLFTRTVLNKLLPHDQDDRSRPRS